MGSASFNYTGGWQTFNVPTGVSTITVSMNGAGAPGNQTGGLVEGTISVSDTDTLYILCGQEGLNGVTGGAGSHSNAGGAASFGAGGAGGPGYNANGGDSGGGYSAIRLNSTSGTIKCVAGGCGGDSGDSGNGGSGGGTTGGAGGAGNAGSGSTTISTGGSQSGPGQGGTSSSGSSFNGGDASSSVLGRAGAGGDTGSLDGPGGGGGGGGYFGGGGGCAGSSGFAPGRGGAGGSSYTGHMASVSANTRGGGGGGGGNVTLTWTDPNVPPATPNISVPAVGLRTSDIGTSPLTASVSSPPLGSTQTRLKVLYDTDSAFGSPQTVYSSYRSTAGSLTVNMTSLSSNSKYYVRAYAQGDSGLVSTSYDTTNFYSDFAPSVPINVGPSGSTLSTGSVTLTADLSDPDSDTVRANFQYDDNATFSTPASISSGYVASGATATASVSGLLTDTQYWVRAQAQDSPGLTSVYSAGVSFWTNRTPLAPTLTKPFSGEVFDSTIAQTFAWTFNDPDSGDSQSGATLQYRPVGSGIWTQVTLTTATTKTFPASTFTNGVTYEWQVQTTDAGGLTGPFSASSTFTGSPPVVSLAAKGALSIAAVDTISQTSAMAALGGLTITPSLIKSPTVPLVTTAAMTITPVQTITRPVAMSAQAAVTITPAITHLPTLAMTGLAGMTVVGVKSVPAVMGFVANGGLLFQSVNGEVLMRGVSGMTILANQLNIQGVSAMSAHAGMSVGPSVTHPFTSAMSSTAAMSIATVVSMQSLIGMAARASVSDSGSLSRIIPVLVSVRAQMAVSGLPTHPGAVVIASQAGMTVQGFANHFSGLVLAAHAGMSVTGHDTLSGGAVAMGASAEMNVNGHRSFTGLVAMSAASGLIFHQIRYTFDPPYLIATDSQGDTLTFTHASEPIPSKIVNKITVGNSGNIAP